MHILFLNPQGNFDQKDSHLTEHPDFGGQLVYVKEVAMALADMGVSVDIVTRQIQDPAWPEFAEPLSFYAGCEDRLRIVRIPCGGPAFLKKELLWPHLDEFTGNLLRFYGDKQPAFATAHYGDGGYCGVLLKQKAGIGFTLTGHSLGAQKLDKLGVTPENFESMDQTYHFSSRIVAERVSMQEAYTIITSTNQERLEQYAHPLYEGAADPDDARKFAVIPPGVNTRIFTTQDTTDDEQAYPQLAASLKEFDPAKPWIIISSRFDEKKNHLGAVEAYASSEELQEKAYLGIFIRGIDDPFTELESLAEKEQKILRPLLDIIFQHNLRENVKFFNIPSQQVLARTYRFFAKRGSLFALTAFYEPFGLAPIEAAACGLAVVATQNGGPSEIFEDGSGVLVDPFDPADIADGFLNALKNAAVYARRGEQRVRAQYTWTRTAASYLNVVQEGMQRHEARNFRLPSWDGTQRILTYLQTRSS